VIGVHIFLELINTLQTTTYFTVTEFVARPHTIEEKIVQELGEEFVAIGICESGLRQYDEGQVLISETADVGIFQINQVHWDNAEALGIDIETIDGNIEYAKILKNQRGTKDWYMSEECWRNIAYNN